jgi:hypothetical protein
VIPLASEEQVGKAEDIAPGDVSAHDKSDITQAAASTFASAMKFVTRAVVVWLIAVFIMIGSALGVIITTVNSIDTVVISHNTELSQTLTAACVLIKSDPTLPLPAGCDSALKNVKTVPTHAGR